MSQDPFDLPMRKSPKLTPVKSGTQQFERVHLNEQQVSTVVDSGAKLVEGALSIAKDIVEIARLNAQSRAEVTGIEARSRSMVAVLRAETDRLMASRKEIRTRGEAAALVIRAVLENIPESDLASRQLAIEKLPEIVGPVVSSQDPQRALEP